MSISKLGIELITHFEGIHDGDLSRINLQPKACPAGIYTCGWGHAIVDPITKKFITSSVKNGYKRACELFKDLTLEEADKLLKEDLVTYENIVNNKVKVELNQSQYDALVGHTFNTGGSDTLFKLINTEPLDSVKIKDWWLNKYTTASGKKLKGLVLRRKDEYNLFLTGKLEFSNA